MDPDGPEQHIGADSGDQGTLQIDGSLSAASQVTIGGTGVLTGTGRAGVVAGVNGRFRPGRDDGTGTFTTGSLSFSAGHTVDFILRPGRGPASTRTAR